MKFFIKIPENKRNYILLILGIFIMVTTFTFNIINNIIFSKNIFFSYQTVIYYILAISFLLVVYKYSIKINNTHRNNILTSIIILSFIYAFYSTGGLYPLGSINDIIYILYFTVIIITVIDSEKYAIMISSIVTLMIVYFIKSPSIETFDILIIESIYFYIIIEIVSVFSLMIYTNYTKFLSNNNTREEIDHTKIDDVNFIKILIEYIDDILYSFKNEEKVILEYTHIKILRRKLKDRIKILQDKKKIKKKIFIFNDIVPKIISSLYPIIKEKDLSLNYLPYTLSQISIQNNYSRIYSILFYTIENAIKFSPNGETIVITTEEKNNMIEIIIHNYSETFNNDESIYHLSYSKGSNGEGFGLFCTKKFIDNINADINIYKDYANLVTTKIEIPN